MTHLKMTEPTSGRWIWRQAFDPLAHFLLHPGCPEARAMTGAEHRSPKDMSEFMDLTCLRQSYHGTWKRTSSSGDGSGKDSSGWVSTQTHVSKLTWLLLPSPSRVWSGLPHPDSLLKGTCRSWRQCIISPQAESLSLCSVGRGSHQLKPSEVRGPKARQA